MKKFLKYAFVAIFAQLQGMVSMLRKELRLCLT